MARKLPTLNTSSSADISFLLLTFFLLVSNISSDQGILRQLPKKSQETKEVEVEISERNHVKVSILSNNIVLLEGAKWGGNNWIMLTDNKSKDATGRLASNYAGEIGHLHELIYDFFANETNDPELSNTQLTYIEEARFGNYPVSQGVVQLYCQNGATHETYIKVHNELSRAINDIRNKLSKERYSKPYKALEESNEAADKEKVKAIRKAVPMNISEPSNNK